MASKAAKNNNVAELTTFRQIIENLKDFAYSMTPEGVFTYVGPQVAKFGYGAEELQGKEFTTIIDDDDKERAVAELHELCSNKRAAPRAYRLLPVEGPSLLVEDFGQPVTDKTGKVIAVSGVIVDVAKTMGEGDERFRQLADMLPALVYEIDCQGNVTYVNKHGFEVTGYSQRDFENGVTALQMIAPEDRERAANNLKRLLGGEQLDGRREYFIARKDGSTYPAIMRSAPIERNGRYVGVRGVILDISEHKEIAADRERLEQQTRQSQKLEAIGQLAGGVAHDFNNMLQIIIVYCDMLLDSMAPEDGLRDDVQEIWNVAHRAAALTRQLLAFSRQQMLSPDIFDLCDVLGPTELILRRTLGEDIDLDVSCEKGTLFVRTDATQLEMVLVNLAVNARQAMPNGGSLSIKAKKLDKETLEQEQKVQLADKSYCLIEVSDNGHGMDAETKERAFDPFFTTSTPGLQAGLGLSTVYGIVKQSNGHIWLTSAPEAGTTVSICLPAMAAPTPREEIELGGKGERVLIVEDDDLLRSSWTRLLEEAGYAVISAPHGREALSTVEKTQEAIDLLITDVVLPEISGNELAARMLKSNDSLRVIFVSGYPGDRVANELTAIEKPHFLQKPVSSSRLLRMVRSVLN